MIGRKARIDVLAWCDDGNYANCPGWKGTVLGYDQAIIRFRQEDGREVMLSGSWVAEELPAEEQA